MERFQVLSSVPSGDDIRTVTIHAHISVNLAVKSLKHCGHIIVFDVQAMDMAVSVKVLVLPLRIRSCCRQSTACGPREKSDCTVMDLFLC